jgi:hypothetical protein
MCHGHYTWCSIVLNRLSPRCGQRGDTQSEEAGVMQCNRLLALPSDHLSLVPKHPSAYGIYPLSRLLARYAYLPTVLPNSTSPYTYFPSTGKLYCTGAGSMSVFNSVSLRLNAHNSSPGLLSTEPANCKQVFPSKSINRKHQ